MIISKKDQYTLRTWEESDAESLTIQLNNKKIWNNCRDALPHPYQLENAQDILHIIREKKGIHDFCIEINGKAVGNIGFTPESDVQRFNAEVGYIIGEAYWNQGIVTDALQDAIRYYFEHTSIVRVFTFVFEYNTPSMRVLEKAGFTPIGIMKKSIYKNNKFWNAHYYELIKKERFTQIVSRPTSFDFDELLQVWENSVRSSHHFLPEEDIQFYKQLVSQYFASVDLYAIRNVLGEIIAFMGLSDELIEMLFVHPTEQGKGLGKQLIRYAIQEKQIRKVDVNEQNVKALCIYQHMGFVITGRDALDPSNKPYPILHLLLE